MACCSSYLRTKCKDPRPNTGAANWLGGPGSFVVEGDSNIQLTDVRRFIHPDAVNIGRGGDTPIQIVEQFPELKASIDRGERSVKGAYIQVGGNLWVWYPLNLFDLNLGIYQEKMKEIISLYQTITPKGMLVIGSLPYVNPKLTLPDMIGEDYWRGFMTKNQWKNFESRLNKIRLVDVLAVGNAALRGICFSMGVKYLDIFTPLQRLYKQGEGFFCGSKYWWDDVHYGLKAQEMVGIGIRRLWGV